MDHLKYLFFFLFEKENRPCDTFAEFKSLANGYPSQFTFNHFSEYRIWKEPGIHLTATSTVLRKQYKDHNEFTVGYNNEEVGYKNLSWENEVSKKLNDINLSLMDLMNQIQKVGGEIIQSINDLSFVTKESTKILDSRLEEINSSVKTNNFLTLINTYLNYKTSKNTKPRKK